jgi:hypothetical protein
MHPTSSVPALALALLFPVFSSADIGPPLQPGDLVSRIHEPLQPPVEVGTWELRGHFRACYPVGGCGAWRTVFDPGTLIFTNRQPFDEDQIAANTEGKVYLATSGSDASLVMVSGTCGYHIATAAVDRPGRPLELAGGNPYGKFMTAALYEEGGCGPAWPEKSGVPTDQIQFKAFNQVWDGSLTLLTLLGTPVAPSVFLHQPVTAYRDSVEYGTRGFSASRWFAASLFSDSTYEVEYEYRASYDLDAR